MPFTSADRSNIRDIFELPREQLENGSVLAGLMSDLELFDIANGTNLVGRVQSNISAILTLQTAVGDAQSSSTYAAQSVRIDGEGQVTYSSSDAIGGAVKGLLEQIERLKKQIYDDLGLGVLFEVPVVVPKAPTSLVATRGDKKEFKW